MDKNNRFKSNTLKLTNTERSKSQWTATADFDEADFDEVCAQKTAVFQVLINSLFFIFLTNYIGRNFDYF